MLRLSFPGDYENAEANDKNKRRYASGIRGAVKPPMLTVNMDGGKRTSSALF
jgi:hypothetical protein